VSVEQMAVQQTMILGDELIEGFGVAPRPVECH
jgi:hypothetical protein